MKSTITKLKHILYFGAMALGFFSTNRAEAQACGAGSQHAYGCGNLYGYCGDIDAVTVKSKSGTLATYSGLTCTGGGGNTFQGVLNAGSPFDLTAGEEITIELTGTAWAGYVTKPGVWIDANRDNSLSGAECLIDPSTTTISGFQSFQVKLPCFSATGKSYLRFRGTLSAYSMSKTQGCGSFSGYGNDFDLEINLKVGTSPVANFIVPTGPNWQGTNVNFIATNPNAGANYKWTFTGASVVTNNNSTKGISQWASAGTYDVKMLVDYCGNADSIVKQVKITAPTSVPVADFIAESNEVELGFNTRVFDLSTNGPTSWAWELITPTGQNNTTYSGQNPIMDFVETGWHEVCLEATNAVGTSNKVCKKRYIECLPTLDNYLGPQHATTTKYGRLFDHNGPTANYSNGRKTSFDYFQILPCGAKEIRIKFTQLKLADNGDIMRIYDGDQADPNYEVTPKIGITNANQSYYDTATIKLYRGAAYITFETNGSGTDAGFIMNWDSDLQPATAPKAKWTTQYDPIGTGVEAVFVNASANTKGVPDFQWYVDGSLYTISPEFSNKFTTDGNYEVCLIATTCTGVDTFCDYFAVQTPSAPGNVGYTASNLRPVIGEVVTITTETDYADNFEWSIFPTSFTFENGTNKNSRNPQIKFSKGGPYTFTLSAWNSYGTKSATEKKIIKNKYVIVLDYCIPLVNMVSTDVAVNNVKVTDKSGKILIDNMSANTTDAYSDFTDVRVMKMTYGASYDLTIDRKTTSNTVNYKTWIDWNIDGDFDDANEEVLSSGPITGGTATSKIVVPALANSFEGKTRMRVGVSYGSFANTPCGVNQVGEFEDYSIQLANDNLPPMINLVGSDTVRVERGTSVSSCYAEVASKTFSASDPTEGDMTNKVVLVSDLDCQTSGVYSISFDLKDASGNSAPTRTRTVIVVLDKTGPVLTLQGNDTINLEQCGTYTEAGAVANDLIDGDLSSAIKVVGSVDPSKVGDYTVTYTVKDAQANVSTKSRFVRVRDTQKPGIFRLGKNITDGMTIDVQINNVFVDDIYSNDPCNGNIFLSKNPGFFGPVNNQIRNTYPIVYNAMDPSGNKATEDGFTINYRVDDYIAPNIELNTGDTLYHDVNSNYSSRSVSVSDNYYPVNKISVVRTGKVDPYTLGTYVETYTATDESGNAATKKRFVKVVDRIAPQMTAPPMSVCVGTPFWANSGLIIKDNYYSSSDLMPLVKVMNHNINIFEAGVYFINYTLIDPSGNEASIVSRSVYVQYPPNCQNTYSGVNSLTLDKAITVYPNPASSKVNVSYALTNTQPLSIEITNAIGAVVATKVVDGGSGVAELNINDIVSGVYFVRMTNNGETTVKKLVIKN